MLSVYNLLDSVCLYRFLFPDIFLFSIILHCSLQMNSLSYTFSRGKKVPSEIRRRERLASDRKDTGTQCQSPHGAQHVAGVGTQFLSVEFLQNDGPWISGYWQELNMRYGNLSDKCQNLSAMEKSEGKIEIPSCSPDESH